MEKYYLGKTLSVYSIFHFLFPAIIGYILKDKWKWGFLIIILFEIIENYSGFTLIVYGIELLTPEPFINIIGDLIIGAIGLFVGHKLRLRR